MVQQIALVDSGNALGNDCTDTQIHRVNRRMLSGRALAVVLAANDDALAHLLRSLRELRIVTVIAVFAHQRNVGTHAGELRACRGNIVGGDIIHSL